MLQVKLAFSLISRNYTLQVRGKQNVSGFLVVKYIKVYMDSIERKICSAIETVSSIHSCFFVEIEHLG